MILICGGRNDPFSGMLQKTNYAAKGLIELSNVSVTYLILAESFLNITFLYLNRFVCKNNGVLYENDIIQIGIKSEFRQNLGRIGVFYGNKTSMPLQVRIF